jgi:transcriptional regulator with XRE-family HTH domain
VKKKHLGGPDGESVETLFVQLTSDERDTLQAAADDQDMTLPEWARQTLMKAASAGPKKGAMRVRKVLELQHEGLTQAEIAERFGVKQPLVAKLSKIGRCLAEPVVSRWEEDGGLVGRAQMSQLAQLTSQHRWDHRTQLAEYKKLVQHVEQTRELQRGHRGRRRAPYSPR